MSTTTFAGNLVLDGTDDACTKTSSDLIDLEKNQNSNSQQVKINVGSSTVTIGKTKYIQFTITDSTGKNYYNPKGDKVYLESTSYKWLTPYVSNFDPTKTTFEIYTDKAASLAYKKDSDKDKNVKVGTKPTKDKEWKMIPVVIKP